MDVCLSLKKLNVSNILSTTMKLRKKLQNITIKSYRKIIGGNFKRLLCYDVSDILDFFINRKKSQNYINMEGFVVVLLIEKILEKPFKKIIS